MQHRHRCDAMLHWPEYIKNDEVILLQIHRLFCGKPLLAYLPIADLKIEMLIPAD